MVKETKGTFNIEQYTATTVEQLPDDLAVLLGRIAHRYSALEQELKLAIYALAGVDEVTGRIAVGTSPRPEEQLNKIEDLATHRNVAINPTLDDFKKLSERVRRERDAVIHGVWIYDTKQQICIIDIQGKWGAGRKDQRVTKRMYPAARPITKEVLSGILRETQEAAAKARGLRLGIEASLQKSHVQAASDLRNLG